MMDQEPDEEMEVLRHLEILKLKIPNLKWKSYLNPVEILANAMSYIGYLRSILEDGDAISVQTKEVQFPLSRNY